ncbi:MAG: hypothetical protein ACPG8W_08655 [Candidatus Promineifilaceae bacterium]
MNTSLLLSLVGGIVIGWLAEYALDLRFWRQSNKRLQADYSALERQIQSTSVDTSTLRMQTSEAADTLSEVNETLAHVNGTLVEREKEIKKLKVLSRLLSAQLKQAQSERDVAITQAKRMHAELAQYTEGVELEDVVEPTIFEFHTNATVSQRLNVAGVKTFDALSRMSDNELYEVVSSKQKRLAKGQGAWRPTTA